MRVALELAVMEEDTIILTLVSRLIRRENNEREERLQEQRREEYEREREIEAAKADQRYLQFEDTVIKNFHETNRNMLIGLLALSLAFALCMGAFAGVIMTSHAASSAYNTLSSAIVNDGT